MKVHAGILVDHTDHKGYRNGPYSGLGGGPLEASQQDDEDHRGDQRGPALFQHVPGPGQLGLIHSSEPGLARLKIHHKEDSQIIEDRRNRRAGGDRPVGNAHDLGDQES